MKGVWGAATLADLATFRSGLWTGKKGPFSTAKVIRNTNIRVYGRLSLDDVAEIAVETKQLESRRLQHGDIILERSGGGPKQAVGRAVCFELVEEKDFSFSNFTSVIRIQDRKRLSYRFLHMVLNWWYETGVTEKIQSNSTGIRNLDFNAYKALEVPLPPLEEQQRIVAMLDEAFEGLDRARANAAANLQNARELYDTAVSEIFAKNGTLTSDQKALGEIAEFRNGLNFTRASSGERVKIVGVGDFKERFTVPVETLSDIVVNGALSSEDCLQEGDLLAVRSNGNKELIGRTMIVPPLSEKVSFSGFTIRIRLTTRNLLPDYLCELMRTKPMRRIMIDAGGGANISNLNQKILANLPISFPSPEAQQAALDSLEVLADRTSILVKAYKSKIADISEFRQSLLQKAFAGELT